MSEYNRDERVTSHDDRADTAFVTRIAQSLKAPEALDTTFEQRLGATIRADAVSKQKASTLGRARTWWTRERTLSLSPLAGLALAAGLAAITVVGTLSVPALRHSRLTAKTVAGAGTRPEVMHLVRFIFVDSSARSVALVGDFNGWNPGLDALEASGNHGAWSISIRLAPGRHEYAFMVDGNRWVADPFGDAVNDEFDTKSSAIQLASDASPNAT